MRCNSCHKETEKGVKVKCSACDNEIFRCDKCRNLSIDYTCKCGKVGP